MKAVKDAAIVLARPLASLRLTVVLFALSMFLILAGTLAQVDEGVWSVVDRYFRSLMVVIPLQLFVPEKVLKVPLAVPFPGGLTLGVVLFVNLLAAHTARFVLSWKRTGIIMAHAGVLLLLVGEFVTGALADEGNMTIDEGASSNFVEDGRSVELAVIDGSDAGEDRVVVVPQRLLEQAVQGGGPIVHPLLPFDVTVNEWMPNSMVVGAAEGASVPAGEADSGIGTRALAVPMPVVTGVEMGDIDRPSVYVTISKGGTRLGSYLVSASIGEAQAVTVDGRAYGVILRFRRTYKPYTVHLIDFRHDVFVGTTMPRNFSSQVRVVEPARNTDREVLISMNSPLRYSGDTLYQASFKRGDMGTILQVVRNPGWLIPYVSCSLVTLGLLVHFGVRLAGSVRRRTA